MSASSVSGPYAAFFDLDGTLAVGNGPPSAADRDAIRAFRLQGNYAFLCTGRSPAFLYPAVLDIGFDGVAVALLGGNSPVGIALAGILFGALSAGAGRMQMLAKVPNATVYITQGLIILFVVGRELFRIRSRRKNKPSSRTAGPRSMEKEAV